MEAPSIFIALLAGFLSFLSPCVLPLVPAYIGYLSGSAVRSRPSAAPVAAQVGGAAATMQARAAATRWIVVANAIVFVLGFTLVFAVLGGLVGSLRDVFAEHRRLLQQIMGVLLVIFGLHMIGLINIPFLNYDRRLVDKLRPGPNLGYLRSFLIGVGFGVGWTPCIGTTLSLIFTLSLNGQQSQAVLPFIAYSIGLGLPFILAAFAMGRISMWLKRLARRSYSLKIGNWTAIDQVNIVSLVSGALLIFMGILIFGNWLTILAPPVVGIDV